MRNLSAKRSLLILAALLVLGVSIFLWYQGLPILYAYLIGISIIALLFYGYDKYQSTHHGFRVPEIILHAITLAGGTPGALLGQQVFRHKTSKRSFRVWFYLIVLVQVIGIMLCLAYIRH
jgi:uncharacterized membrane protein YsdA (DUF1294 family)